jgi:hypothetical protein
MVLGKTNSDVIDELPHELPKPCHLIGHFLNYPIRCGGMQKDKSFWIGSLKSLKSFGGEFFMELSI